MSVNIHPAYVVEKTVTHADNWSEESTLNLAQANFWSMIKEYNLEHLVTSVPAHITLKAMETALSMHRSPRYHEKLKRICAQAHVLKARHIAFT